MIRAEELKVIVAFDDLKELKTELTAVIRSVKSSLEEHTECTEDEIIGELAMCFRLAIMSDEELHNLENKLVEKLKTTMN